MVTEVSAEVSRTSTEKMAKRETKSRPAIDVQILVRWRALSAADHECTIVFAFARALISSSSLGAVERIWAVDRGSPERLAKLGLWRELLP